MDDLLKIIKLTHEFQKVKRVIYYPKNEERETDPEHSYQLAIAAWYIISSRHIPLDISLTIKYALIHDLVEAYAGDVMFYRTEAESKKKAEKEKKAIERLQKEFPEFRDLHHLISQYEKKATKEAQFVYALDKLIPIINIYLDNGRIWKEHDITFEKLVTNKVDKIKISPEVKKYFDEMCTILEEKPDLFSKKG